MIAESLGQQPGASTPTHGEVQRLVREACEPVANFWPMKRFTKRNPIQGWEHLPFDDAVGQARHLLGGRGYLSNAEYRQAFRSGRIGATNVAAAMRRAGPDAAGQTPVPAGAGSIAPHDVWRAQLLFDCEPLEPMLLAWTLGAGGALERVPSDLPGSSAERLLERAGGQAGVAAYLRALWQSAVQAGQAEAAHEPHPVTVDLPAQRTVADWVERLSGTSLVEPINGQATKWVAAFVDEGMAGWEMPCRDQGLYRTWRQLAPRDLSGRFLGIRHFSESIRNLPAAPEDAISLMLYRLGVPTERWQEYLSRHLAQLHGWAGLIRWLGENPGYPGQAGHPATPVDYLAVRLFYEAELADMVCRKTWGIPGTVAAIVAHWHPRADEYRRLMAPEPSHDASTEAACARAWPLFRLAQHLELTPGDVGALSPTDVAALVGWLAAFPAERHGPVWLEAYEDAYRQGLLAQLAGQHGVLPAGDDRPRAQVVLCIDVRSESFRRHIEAQGPYETFGYAGFFGVTMNHEAFDGGERYPLCPVLLTPRHAVDETVRPDQQRPLQSYASGTRWSRLADHLFHDVKQNPVASFMLVDVLGYFFTAGLAGKTLAPAFYGSITASISGWFRHPVTTRVAVEASDSHHGEGARGFATAEQAAIVEGGLRAIGLTDRLGRLVVLCGHGSVTDNNPYFGALHCGACGGKHGDANARAFAVMANDPQVREMLGARGLTIPDDTWFLAAKHITTSDRVEFYDVDDLPVSHREDLRALSHDLELAGSRQALERCERMPWADVGASPARAYRHVAARTVDWANVRPEWGLSGNAAFIIGRRRLTRQLNLQGRSFLHSYDPEQDGDGGILEKIMTAPLIVGQMINLQYYFSGVDPWFWGSGSKVIHNVVSGVGVMLGSQSDLQTGLPLQTVNDGAIHYHEPMRLLAVIDAPAARISSVIQKHAVLQKLLHNQWLNLVAVGPTGLTFERYNVDGTWESVAIPDTAPGPSQGPR